jgi:hypothetical protein
MDPEGFFTSPSAKSPRVRSSARRRGGFWDGNWISFTLMVPFIALCVARVPLGISDAFLMGDRRDADYNVCMMLALLLGSVAFLVHTFALPSDRGYGWGWVPPKIIFLAACWAIFVAVEAFVTRFQS